MYSRDELDNGIRVIMETIPYVNSTSIGIFINNGITKEDKSTNGISHFIEHMLFKGTKNRTAKNIAQSIDNIGGQINAYTSTEYTCFYIKVLDRHLSIAVELLSDMFHNSLFDEEDIEKEKGVISEEIKMYLDSPEDLVYDLLSRLMFENTTLALPILGSYETINSFTRESILKYYNRNYIPENMVISVVGNFNSKNTLELLNENFNNNSIYTINNNKSNNMPNIKQNLGYKHKDIEQLNLCIGMEGVKRGSDALYPLLVLNNIFGGSMSSRLFQKIREDKGLAYSVYSHTVSFQETGAFNIYAGLGVDQIINVAKLISGDIQDLKINLITKDELTKSKEQLKGNYILGMESTFNRMLDIGRSELLLNKMFTPEEVLKKIDVVKMDDIGNIVYKIFDKAKYNIAYVGKLDDHEKIQQNLKEIFFN